MIGNLARIAAPDIRRIPPLAAFKPGSQSATANGGYVSDTDLYLNLEANSAYRFLLTAWYTFPQASDGGNKVNFRFTAPQPLGTAGGWNLSASCMSYYLDASNTPFLNLFTALQALSYFTGWGSGSASAPAMQPLLAAGTVRTSNAGTLALQWQGLAAASSPVTTVNACSELDAWKVA